MGTPKTSLEQRKRNDKLIDEIVRMAANGDGDAERYIKDIAFVSRIMDDLIDKDCPVSDRDIFRSYFVLLAELYANPFFLRNMSALTGLHIVAYNAWVDATAWEKKGQGELKNIYAHVLKDFVNELCPVVAFLTGGHDLMRKVSQTMREMFLKEVV